MPISRILFPVINGTAVIYLARILLFGSSDLPEGLSCLNRISKRTALPPYKREDTFCLTLHQAGFIVSRIMRDPKRDPRCYHRSGELLPRLFTLSLQLISEWCIFCDTFRIPLMAGPRALPGTLFYGVRTFLYSRRVSANSNCSAFVINCSFTSYLFIHSIF